MGEKEKEKKDKEKKEEKATVRSAPDGSDNYDRNNDDDGMKAGETS